MSDQKTEAAAGSGYAGPAGSVLLDEGVLFAFLIRLDSFLSCMIHHHRSLLEIAGEENEARELLNRVRDWEIGLAGHNTPNAAPQVRREAT